MKAPWVGIDPGEKRIGMARSDPLGIAHPQDIVSTVDELVGVVKGWLDERDLGGVVVGLPLNMDGSVGPIARRSLVLVRTLRQRLPLEVRLWDERLSSRQVEVSGPSTGAIDARVAAVILQTFLDAGAPLRPDPPEMGEIGDQAAGES